MVGCRRSDLMGWVVYISSHNRPWLFILTGGTKFSGRSHDRRTRAQPSELKKPFICLPPTSNCLELPEQQYKMDNVMGETGCKIYVKLSQQFSGSNASLTQMSHAKPLNLSLPSGHAHTSSMVTILYLKSAKAYESVGQHAGGARHCSRSGRCRNTYFSSLVARGCTPTFGQELHFSTCIIHPKTSA